MRSATWPFLIKTVCLQTAGSDRVIDDVSAPSTWYAIEASARRCDCIETPMGDNALGTETPATQRSTRFLIEPSGNPATLTGAMPGSG
jgi:hypothetical protein